MALSLLHATQATGTDAGNGDIHKAEWNQEHAIVMATNKLLGRSTAGTGSVEEITIGSGLSLSAGTLSASGGGGGSLTINNQTAAYTVVAGDLGTIINCTSGTFTVSLTAAATLGSGFNCWIWNTSTTAADAITIDPNASETIDGRTTLVLQRGEGMQIVCDGTNWQTGDKKTMRGYAENYTATATRPVATGSNAISLGNSYASGTGSFAAAIENNTSTYGAQAADCIAMGNTAKANNVGVAIGYTATATGTYSIALNRATASGETSIALGTGGGNARVAASGISSIVIGDSSYASATDSIAIGRNGIADKIGKFVRSTRFFSSMGDSQTANTLLKRATTDATATLLTANNTTADATNQIVLVNNSAYTFSGLIVARQKASDGTASAAWKVEGLIRREANAGTTSLVASTVTAISNVPGWTLALSADTTNGCLAITITGAAATNIRWVANIDTVELTYA